MLCEVFRKAILPSPPKINRAHRSLTAKPAETTPGHYLSPQLGKGAPDKWSREGSWPTLKTRSELWKTTALRPVLQSQLARIQGSNVGTLQQRTIPALSSITLHHFVHQLAVGPEICRQPPSCTIKYCPIWLLQTCVQQPNRVQIRINLNIK